MSLRRGSIIVICLAWILWYSTHIYPNEGLSADEHHEYFELKNIWTEEAASRLLSFVEKQGYFTTVVEDNTAKVEHIGEAKMPVNGTCEHHFQVLNRDRTKCILPSRLDVGKHFLMTGGISAHKEPYEVLVSRMLPFGGYFFDKLKENEDLRLLFDSPVYKEQSAKVCEGRTVMDPIQLSILINLPGQETPMHLDVPWFFGGHRFNIPQWLLVVMEQSRLWEDLRVPQVQGVAYLHRWNHSVERGGDFFFYAHGPGGNVTSIPPEWNSGIVLDGSRCVHGITPYLPHRRPPLLRKEGKNELKFEGGRWSLYTDGSQVAQYDTQELRVAFVWRDRCFHTEEERKRWHETQDMSIEEILTTLEKDLRKRGKLGPDQSRPEPMEFALMLLQEYARYPYPPSWFPFNYCTIAKLPSFQSLQPLVDLICK